jgi:hypothetical protein
MTRVRPKIGDVCEVPTPKGLGYFQYTHKHAEYGALIRVMPGLFDMRPDDFAPLVQCHPQFVTFYPLGAACARRLVTIIANLPIPASSEEFPIFRTGMVGVDGSVKTWLLWDGVNSTKVGPIRPDMLHLPRRGIVNHALLVDRIAMGWQDQAAT